MKNRIYLTGATGFLGSHLLKLLIEKGDKITCLVRSPEKLKHINTPNVTIIKGDITDRDSIKKSIPGHNLVFHLAAWLAVGVKHSEYDMMRRVNVEGTQNILEEANAVGVKKIINCSSVAVLGPSGPVGSTIDESKRITLQDNKFYSYYESTKREAYLSSCELIKERFPIMNILPGFIFGPGDNNIVTQQIVSIINRTLIGIPIAQCAFSYVHVKDVAEGFLLASEKGRIGEDYILSGEIMPTHDFLCLAAKEANVKMPKLRLPLILIRLLTWIYENIPGGKVISRDIPLSKEMNNFIKENWAYSSKKSVEELEWKYRSVKEGLVDTVKWIKENICNI